MLEDKKYSRGKFACYLLFVIDKVQRKWNKAFVRHEFEEICGYFHVRLILILKTLPFLIHFLSWKMLEQLFLKVWLCVQGTVEVMHIYYEKLSKYIGGKKGKM